MGYDVLEYLSEVANEFFRMGLPVNGSNLLGALRKTKFKGLLGEVDFSKGQIAHRQQPVTVVHTGKFKLQK